MKISTVCTHRISKSSERHCEERRGTGNTPLWPHPSISPPEPRHINAETLSLGLYTVPGAQQRLYAHHCTRSYTLYTMVRLKHTNNVCVAHNAGVAANKWCWPTTQAISDNAQNRPLWTLAFTKPSNKHMHVHRMHRRFIFVSVKKPFKMAKGVQMEGMLRQRQRQGRRGCDSGTQGHQRKRQTIEHQLLRRVMCAECYTDTEKHVKNGMEGTQTCRGKQRGRVTLQCRLSRGCLGGNMSSE